MLGQTASYPPLQFCLECLGPLGSVAASSVRESSMQIHMYVYRMRGLCKYEPQCDNVHAVNKEEEK